MTPRPAALAALMALMVMGSVRAAPPPADAFSLVARAIEARRTLRFVARQDILFLPPAGSALSWSPGLTQIMTDVTRDGRRVRMVYWLPCDATHRIVVDDGRRSLLWEPTRRSILADTSVEESEAVVRRMLALLHRNYRCVLLRRERVNGLSCDVVVVRPRHAPGPSRILWIERTRDAILQTEERDAAGQRRYLSFFETFRYVGRVPASAFTLPPASHVMAVPRPMRDVSSFQAAFAAAGMSGCLPAWLPPGYVLVGCAVSGRKHEAAVLRYGDGLKTVSVFEEAGVGNADAPERQAMLRRSMARFGQQAWVLCDPTLCITILGDATLPDNLGQDMLRALSRDNDRRLARGLVRDFADAPPAAPLRRQGWGYEQIAALALYQRAHPAQAGRIGDCLRRQQSWPQIASTLHADTDWLDGRARRWIAATLTAP